MDKETLLIVEDNHELRNGLKEILSFEGFTVLTAANGRDALRQMESVAPDLILSDISMPEMDGYQFFDAVRSRQEGVTIPFIFLTARGDREEEMHGKNLGAEDYLIKPLTRSELLAAVQSKLSRFRQLQQAQLEQAYEASLLVLTNVIEVRDRYTRGHVERVRDYALAIAEYMNFPASRRQYLRFGAILHDIGKILVPEGTLTKTTRLSGEEWNEMQQHPIIGAEMLKDIPFLAPAIPIVRYHHERWDGRGYPDRLKGEAIPLEARIVSLADGFDAMTTTRPYHQAWPMQQAYDEINNDHGRYFDPKIVAAFQQAWADSRIQHIANSWHTRHRLTPR